MPRRVVASLLAVLLLVAGGTAGQAKGLRHRAAAAVGRPSILGISHVALRVSNVAASLSFYEDFLGYRALSGTAGTARPLEHTLIAVNERQYIELSPGLAADEDRLDHIAFETDDVDAARRHLASRGVGVPEHATSNPAGNRSFAVTDPEGHAIEFVVQPRDAWPRVEVARPGRSAISRRILHAGILVGDLSAATRFYGDILGFGEIWRGSRSGTELSWTNMKVPDGGDYVEFMLYAERPAPTARGSQHHICLEVPDAEDARARLLARPHRASYARPLEVRVGTNRRRQLNLFDPDGTRVELMEPHTVDGQPVPSSTAPPPRRP